jgi:hypothetical protein
VAAAAHARLAQSYAVGTLYLPSRHVPNRSDGANLPQSPAMTTIESRHHTRIWVLIARVLLGSHTFAPYSQAEISSEVV